MSKKDTLRKEAEGLGLATTGTIKDLRQRIADHAGAEEAPTEKVDSVPPAGDAPTEPPPSDDDVPMAPDVKTPEPPAEDKPASKPRLTRGTPRAGRKTLTAYRTKYNVKNTPAGGIVHLTAVEAKPLLRRGGILTPVKE